jgi:2-keto-4-pentenoate hydratase/2-oxohepta-3-ene-1,7-dioic acid hydratase in catechol pathway
MRIARLDHEGRARWAELVDDRTGRLFDGAPHEGGRSTDERVTLDPARLLAPVTPTKVVCVGRNYRDHAKELGNEVPKEPLLFLKPPSAIVRPGGAIELPPESERVEHEGELAVVVGRTLRRASRAEALAAILGVTAANDVTARDLQRRDVQFTRGKGFDTFCPIGAFVETAPGPLEALRVITRVDGVERQNGSVADMIWPVDELLAYVSRVMTLLPGDVLLTGTPAGVGPLTAGNVVEVEIGPGIAHLSSPVRAG